MRLICPNCGAQYDISNDAIPEGGRDVQCSSCAHTWFQTDKPIVEGRAPGETLAAVETDNAPASDTPTPPPVPAPERKTLDTSISAILREELAHERRARATDSDAPPATQENAPPPRVDADETRRRISQLTRVEGGTPASAAASVAAASTGAVESDTNVRTVPSIDEINSALRARAEASDKSGLTEAEKQDAIKRRGFRRGFFFVLILIAILITPYFFQDLINENLPQLRPYMASYVEIVDQMRVMLNEQVQRLRTLIEGFMAGDEAA
ncbi:zinc-ribbon domain-containing protein [Yoonia sp. BS5-3]|uniref:Zinc-ribbon domain-containing protein n=1 Tax=Yoonia phaeophyticola TaxID=3137369 RepID=A0ABZ2V7D4_9RHOB